MIIYDFFAGTGSATKAFEDAGHTVIRIEIDTQFEAHERNIMGLDASYLISKYGQPDLVWASPPCTAFSVASIGKHWNKDKTPKSMIAFEGLSLLNAAVSMITSLQPEWWIIENPRGMMRNVLGADSRRTVTYCQYGDTRQKPTDLWTNINHWTPRPMCKPKAKCHEAAPRGSRTGTQGIKGAKLRSMVPYELGKEILESIS